MISNVRCATTMPEDGHLIWITTHRFRIILDPSQRLVLIEQSLIAGKLVLQIQITKNSQSVVDRDHDRVGGGHERRRIVDVNGARASHRSAAMKEDHDRRSVGLQVVAGRVQVGLVVGIGRQPDVQVETVLFELARLARHGPHGKAREEAARRGRRRLVKWYARAWPLLGLDGLGASAHLNGRLEAVLIDRRLCVRHAQPCVHVAAAHVTRVVVVHVNEITQAK